MVRKSLVLVALIAACRPSTPKIPDAPESIAGRVTMVKQSGDGIGTVRVEALPGDGTGSAKAVVRITKATAVVGAPVAGTADFGALRPGQWVRVWFLGPVRESYPVQANAGTIVIDSISTNTLLGQPLTGADSIVLERSMCYGTCPAYRVRLSAAGEIRFESRTEAGRTTTMVVSRQSSMKF